MHISRRKRKLLYRTRSVLSQIVLAIFDLATFNLGPLIAILLVMSLWGNLDNYIPDAEIVSRLGAHFLLSLSCVVWFWARLRHYTYRKTFWFELKDILHTLAIFAVIDLAIIAFSKWHLSRYIWVFTWSSILVLLPLFRFFAKVLLQRLNLWQKQCVIIGTGSNATDAFNALHGETDLGLDIQYFFANHAISSRQYLHGLPVIGDERLLWRTTDRRHTQYIIALDDGQEKLGEHWIKQLAMRRCTTVSVVPTMRGLPLNSTDMSFIFRHEVLILRINSNLTKKSARFLKRSFDLCGSLLIVLLLSPLLLGLALLVMRDGGPPIYGHTRVGRDGTPFKCLKFRSMIMNSQEVLARLLDNDPAAREEWQRDFKLKDDPRITKVGHFLRMSSLDELPQLLNVIRGDMSLVGPRPVVTEELQRYGSNKEYYLMAKPGMTGLWQVSGRNNVDYDTRIYFDAWYVKNWSLWNDIAILFKTIRTVLKREGAY
ncbi:undecaprenyl-phosphate galactose phosphotransferase WbaP [Corticimicrobacter populi]|uniref:UDP-phosphate galactose phosphotransferase n=1 Tax=Corticimicrobacter populi TaxID=2175229 RepID=A0A2V1JXG5_9BURK|nr:undecaprenyl-phosphate galactose phosphotransferase WbaP [Corticimicrobacter populi]PWF22184.1 UDP-phosphate galactose phosphotransferase [Corticimicrobacter populi]